MQGWDFSCRRLTPVVRPLSGRFVQSSAQKAYCNGSLAVSQPMGFTLIEVLVTLVLVSLGFLGFLKAQGLTLQQSYHEHFKAQAIFLASSLADSMQSNASALAAGSYILPRTIVDYQSLSVWPKACSASAPCNSVDQADFDLRKLQHSILNLPEGSLAVEKTAQARYRIVIAWRESGQVVSPSALSCPLEADLGRQCVVLEVASHG